ncbi:MAG TPA: ClpXP protease specificity-enhancing factor SspB [Xanthobacteraceae bacterium]|nr:ClpXP protease specificity-enhancing factor SspB [Xanthobacteraceae bacterium]
MPVDHIRYDLLVREALRDVVRRIMADVAKNGLPGDHHFYISFNTRAPGVRLSPRLREQYPEEMTIVLQHQFWDLTVDEHGLEVGLSFGGIPEKLAIPFDALKGFFDPSVQFGLEFEPAGSTGDTAGQEEQSPTGFGATAGRTAARPAADTGSAPALPAHRDAEATGEGEPPTKPAGGAEVVRLDRFRKK